jgi:hypothetical protein
MHALQLIHIANRRRVPGHQEGGAQRPQDTQALLCCCRTQETPGAPEDTRRGQEPRGTPEGPEDTAGGSEGTVRHQEDRSEPKKGGIGAGRKARGIKHQWLRLGSDYSHARRLRPETENYYILYI